MDKSLASISTAKPRLCVGFLVIVIDANPV